MNEPIKLAKADEVEELKKLIEKVENAVNDAVNEIKKLESRLDILEGKGTGSGWI